MIGRDRKRLPWTYREALGYGGKRLDEERARNIVRRVGLDATNDLGDTPLTVAAELGQAGMVRWLLGQGADVEDVVPHKYFKSALCAAAYGKCPEVAALLIVAGANLEARDRFGNTPLANAFINCFTDPLPLAALLIQQGAEVTERVRELGESCNAVAFHALLEDMALAGQAGPLAAPDRAGSKRKRGSRSPLRRGR
jgi:ankyrin repeat protein